MTVSGSVQARDARRVDAMAVRRRGIVGVRRDADDPIGRDQRPPAARRRRDRSRRSGAGARAGSVRRPAGPRSVLGKPPGAAQLSVKPRPPTSAARTRPDSAAAAASGAPTHAPSAAGGSSWPVVDPRRLRAFIACRQYQAISRGGSPLTVSATKAALGRHAGPARVEDVDARRRRVGVGHQQAAVADRRLPEIERRRRPERHRPAGDEVELVQAVGHARAEAADRRRECPRAPLVDDGSAITHAKVTGGVGNATAEITRVKARRRSWTVDHDDARFQRLLARTVRAPARDQHRAASCAGSRAPRSS